jgi:hypothetical protein
MNILPILGNIGAGLAGGYMMGNAPSSLYGNKQGAMPTDLGGGVQSGILPGVAPGATVPLQTGSGAQGGMFGGTGQGLTNASAGLFQPQGGASFFGNGPSQAQQMGMMNQMSGGQMNPLALALMMRR